MTLSGDMHFDRPRAPPAPALSSRSNSPPRRQSMRRARLRFRS